MISLSPQEPTKKCAGGFVARSRCRLDCSRARGCLHRSSSPRACSSPRSRWCSRSARTSTSPTSSVAATATRGRGSSPTTTLASVLRPLGLARRGRVFRFPRALAPDPASLADASRTPVAQPRRWRRRSRTPAAQPHPMHRAQRGRRNKTKSAFGAGTRRQRARAADGDVAVTAATAEFLQAFEGRTQICRLSPDPVKPDLMSAKITQSRTNLTNFDQSCPGIDQTWPRIDQHGLNLGPIWIWATHGPKLTSFGQHGLTTTKLGSTWAKFGPISVRFGPPAEAERQLPWEVIK